MKRIMLLLTLFGIGIGGCSPLHMIQTGGWSPDNPPYGWNTSWRNFCIRTNNCYPDTPIELAINLETLALLNSFVNNNIRYTSESMDSWDDGLRRGEGDCDDYMVAKLNLLLDRGVPRRNLRLAIMQLPEVTSRGRPLIHALLLIYNYGEWWALDQRYDALMRPRELPYSNWVIEPTRGIRWQSFDPRNPPRY